MVNLYVMQDRVSGTFGSVFESFNDESLKRDFINIVSNLDLPDYVVDDFVVLYLGVFDDDEKNPFISPASFPRVVLRGDDIEIRKARERAISASSGNSV